MTSRFIACVNDIYVGDTSFEPVKCRVRPLSALVEGILMVPRVRCLPYWTALPFYWTT